MTDKKNNNEQDSDTPFQKAVAIKKARHGDVKDGYSAPAHEAENALPKITAKGTGEFAERILNIAFEKGVRVRQDKELTDLLEHFDVESPIPLEALDVVSDILRHVYLANNSLKPENSNNPDENE